MSIELIKELLENHLAENSPYPASAEVMDTRFLTLIVNILKSKVVSKASYGDVLSCMTIDERLSSSSIHKKMFKEIYNSN